MLLRQPWKKQSARGREHLLSSQHGMVAWQYNEPIFKATLATSQFPSANAPLLSTCTPAEQPSTTSPARGQIHYQLLGEAQDGLSLGSEAVILWARGRKVYQPHYLVTEVH